MEKDIIERWEKGKENLRNWIKSHEQKEYGSYEDLVIALIENALNYDVKSVDRISTDIDISDHGDYQGTQIFLIHRECYQPSCGDYWIFDNYYGSCSGCDTLLSISQYDWGLPTDEKVEEYMHLCLHIVQRMKSLGNVLNE